MNAMVNKFQFNKANVPWLLELYLSAATVHLTKHEGSLP